MAALATGVDDAGEQGEGARPGLAARSHHDPSRDQPIAQRALGLVIPHSQKCRVVPQAGCPQGHAHFTCAA